MELNDFKPGDILELTQCTKNVTEFRTCQVTAVNYNGLGLVTFVGHRVDYRLDTGSGTFDPTKVGTTPYGFACRVRKIGHRKLWADSFRGPRPGDRAYDLMC